MKQYRIEFLVLMTSIVFLTSCSPVKNMTYRLTKNYTPDNQELYDTIVRLDSIFFAAYNTCTINLDKYGSFYADDIEFYHDQAGLNTSKQEIIEATKRNICGKVTRELIEGSIEVYPVRDFGAIEFGLHEFHNNQEPEGSASKAGRFVIFWEHKNNEWKIKKVISLH